MPVGARDGSAQGFAEVAAGVIYGADDRVELEALEDTRVRGIAAQQLVALVPADALRTDGDRVSIQAPLLQERLRLCPDEAFVDQPSLARCSGVVIDHDLVLTAGHCVRATADCAGIRIVSGWATNDGVVPDTFAATQVRACQQVVLSRVQLAAPLQDHAVLRVWPPFEQGGPELGGVPLPQTLLTVTGHGAGLPAKADANARVVDVAPDVWRVQTDAFAGNSGSPAWNDAGQLVALLVRGASDWVTDGGCTRARVLLDDDAPGEGLLPIQTVIDDLCALGWPSLARCGQAPTCGDGWCTGEERDDTCDQDCTVSLGRCGDGLCSADEASSGSCALDCAPSSPPPSAWTCEPRRYDGRDGCDCDCGAPDPDCERPGPVFGCALPLVCEEGRCVPPPAVHSVPPTWRCDPTFYAANDGCDCRCGAPDPDCELVGARVLNCLDNQVCEAGLCVDASTTADPDPATDVDGNAGPDVAADSGVPTDVGRTPPSSERDTCSAAAGTRAGWWLLGGLLGLLGGRRNERPRR